MPYKIEMNDPRSYVPEYQEIFKDSSFEYPLSEILAVAAGVSKGITDRPFCSLALYIY